MRAMIAALSMGLLAMAPGSAHAGGDPEAGKAKSAVCAGCHGIDGNSTNPQWPKLAGQHAIYLVTAVHAYKSGARKNSLMKPMVQELSDEDIEDLAAFYSSQKQK